MAENRSTSHTRNGLRIPFASAESVSFASRQSFLECRSSTTDSATGSGSRRSFRLGTTFRTGQGWAGCDQRRRHGRWPISPASTHGIDDLGDRMCRLGDV